MVLSERIVAIISPDSAPVKRLVQDSRASRRLLDCTCGRRTRSVIVTDSDHIILSAVQTETIAARNSEADSSVRKLNKIIFAVKNLLLIAGKLI